MSASPYKFLNYYDFTEQDARLFFGRDRETQILLSDILVARLVVLFAETGTGKTSLINAGVRPRLEERGYASFVVRVREDPTASARAELSSLLDLPELRGGTLADQLANLAEDLEKPIVIFFDQFEEFFISTFRENPLQAQAFIEDIARLYENNEAGVHIVFSLREDWFVEMDHFRDEIPTIFHNDSNLRLRWFDKKQAREAIRGPAAAFGAEIEPRLIVQITRDLLIKNRGIEPAQLQIVCDALWKHHTGLWIRLKEDYAKLGQSTGTVNIAKQILDQHFENIFSAIRSDEYLNILERLLPLLRTERNTKFGREFDILIEMLETDSESLNALLKHLEEAQLIRRSRREGLTIVELAHDYLAPQVLNLQQRVQAISLRRLLKNAMQRTKEREDALTEERPAGGVSMAEPIGGDLEAHYLSSAEFEALTNGTRVLGDLSLVEASFLFEAALERGSEIRFWFERAREGGVAVWEVLEQKIVDPRALISQAENAVRLLGVLRTEQALGLLAVALQQDALAPRAVDVLGDLKTDAALALLTDAVNKRKLTGPVFEKLGEMRFAGAVKALEGFLQEQDLSQHSASALERLSRSREPLIASQAKEVLDRWQRPKSQAQLPPPMPERSAYEIQPSYRHRAGLTAETSGSLDEVRWASLLRHIAQGKCTPLLGPGLVKGSLLDPSNLAQDWAAKYGYPLADYDNLAHVAQFVATEYDPVYLRQQLTDRVTGIEPDFNDPAEPHRILASLPLPVYLTTNHDDFMYQALLRQNKSPVREYCRWQRSLSGESSTLDSGYRPSVATPLVFHLWGHTGVPDSIVITEDDRLDFLVATAHDRDLIPLPVQDVLVNSSLLLVGFRTSDPDLSFLLRNFLGTLFGMRSRRWAHIAAQVLVVNEQTSQEQIQKSLKYFDHYFKEQDINVYWGTAREFLMGLRDRWKSEREFSG
jgi:hypothetical protein